MKNNNNKNIQERNYGIDMLRIVSTMMITILHVLGDGGVLKASEHASSINYGFFWLLHISCYCAVNCYALISGYVGYSETEKRHGYHKYFGLWFQAFCYSVIFWLLGCIAMPDTTSVKDIVKSFFPVTFEQYWYFTAYTGVFFLQPWMNRFVRRASSSEMKRGIVVFAVFSCYSSLVSFVVDPFHVKKGFSMLWLCALYIVGAWMKKAEIAEKLRVKNTVGFGIALLLITWVSKMVIPLITEPLFGNVVGSDILVKYISPTVVGISIVLLVLFSKISIGRDGAKKIVTFVASSTFGIYLVQTHPWVYRVLIIDAFAWVANEPLIKAVAVVFLAVLGIFLLSMLVERIRILLFRICRISKICCVLEEYLRKKLDKTNLIG